MFRDCGSTAYIALLVAILAVVGSGIALALAFVRPRVGRYVGLGALFVAMAPVGIGALGMMMGRMVTNAALDSGAIDPSVRERLMEEGYREAAGCLTVGGLTAALPLCLALVAVFVGFARSGPQAAR